MGIRDRSLEKFCIMRYVICKRSSYRLENVKFMLSALSLIQGIFVGYRSYEIRKLTPLFPFGFGLSYTTFKYSDLKTSAISEEGKFSVNFSITNTGNTDGREIAQVYISDKDASLPRPVKELKAFTKVSLAVGESKAVTLHLDREALGFYDDRAGHWIAEKGEFTVRVGASSNDLKLTETIELGRTLTWNGL